MERKGTLGGGDGIAMSVEMELGQSAQKRTSPHQDTCPAPFTPSASGFGCTVSEVLSGHRPGRVGDSLHFQLLALPSRVSVFEESNYPTQVTASHLKCQGPWSTTVIWAKCCPKCFHQSAQGLRVLASVFIPVH